MIRRWSIRLVVVLAGLLLAAVIAVPIILSSDYPRRLAVDIASKQTGMDVRIGRLDIGLSGRTTIEQLDVRLPDTGDSMLTADRIVAGHSSLAGIIFTLGFELSRVEITNPHVTAREDEHGRWNVLEAVDIIQQLHPPDEDAEPLESVPAIAVRDGVVTAHRADGSHVEYRNLNFNGHPGGARVWQFDGGAEPHLTFRGQVRITPAWQHEISITGRDLNVLAAPWVDTTLPNINTSLSWTGRVREDATVNGRLQLDRATVGDITGSGAMSISAGAGEATVRFERFLIDPAGAAPETIQIAGGTVRADAESLSFNRLRLAGYDAQAELRGDWHFADRQGRASGKWSGDWPGQQLQHDGTFEAAVELPAVGPLRADLHATTRGRRPAGRFGTELRATAAGPDFETLRGEIVLPQTWWHPADAPRRTEIGRTAVSWRRAGETLEITNVELPRTDDARLTATYEFNTQQWRFDTHLGNVNLTPLFTDRVDLSVSAEGMVDRVDHALVHVTAGDTQVTAHGRYDPQRPHPLDAIVNIDAPSPAQAAHAAGQDVPDDLGRWTVDVHVTGDVQPLRLAVDGRITGQSIPVAAGAIDRLDIDWQAHIDDRIARVASEQFELLGGQWEIASQYVTIGRTVTLHTAGRDLPASRLAEVLGWPLEIEGESDVTLQASLDLTAPDLNAAHANGEWTLRDFSAGDLRVSRGSGRLRLREGVLELHELELTERSGVMLGSARLDLADPGTLQAKFSTVQWPVTLDDHEIALQADAEGTVVLDLLTATSTGTLTADVSADYRGEHLTSLRFDAALNNRTVIVQQLQADIADGRINGQATIPLDDWTKTEADLFFTDIRPAALATHLPPHTELPAGTIGGRGRLQPTIGNPRALGPLSAEINLTMVDGRWRAIDIDDIEIITYLSPRRVVLDTFNLDIAGGRVGMWMRLNRHGEELTSYVRVSFDEIDLSQLMESARPDADPVVGRLNGHGVAGGYLQSPHRAFGEAEISLSDSDLINLPGLAQVYSLLNIGFDGFEPSGEGTAIVRLEGDRLRLTDFSYFNRGTELWATAEVANIWQGMSSPLRGIAAGTGSPLRDTKTPIIAELGRMIRAAQANVVSVRIAGTLEEPETTVVPVGEVTGALRRIITGEVD